MGKFDNLTAYISEFEKGNFGEWIIDHELDGTPEKPIHFPFVAYYEIMRRFIDDVYRFVNEHPKWN